MASTFLSRAMGTPTDATKQTLSVWVKLASSGDYQGLVSSQYNSTAGGAGHFLGASESIYTNWTYDGSANNETRTTALARDFSGWYHIVSTQDASQSGTDKSKIWINGVLQTNFVNDNRSNFSTHASWFANGKTLYIGKKFDNTLYFNGTMSHLHLCDGYAYQASDFGSFDNATGEWKINTVPNVNYGNQGFFILKDTNSGTDQSGNSNNFTVGGGTLTKTEDCPNNVFATWNPLEPELSYKGTYSNGNTTVATTTTGGTSLRGSIAIPYTGKWYWENKVVSTSGTIADNSRIGIATGDSVTVGSNVRYMSNGQKTVDASASSYGATYGAGDIIGVAVDSDNNTVEFFKNGASQGSISYTMDSSLTYKPYISENSNTISITFSTNFGNGYFGTTAVSSAGTNASNNGIFEYDVPTGYTALSTKGLNL